MEPYKAARFYHRKTFALPCFLDEKMSLRSSSTVKSQSASNAFFIRFCKSNILFFIFIIIFDFLLQIILFVSFFIAYAFICINMYYIIILFFSITEKKSLIFIWKIQKFNVPLHPQTTMAG